MKIKQILTQFICFKITLRGFVIFIMKIVFFILIKIFKEKETWGKAQKKCNSYGGNIISWGTPEEHQFTKRLLL